MEFIRHLAYRGRLEIARSRVDPFNFGEKKSNSGILNKYSKWGIMDEIMRQWIIVRILLPKSKGQLLHLSYATILLPIPDHRLKGGLP